VQNPEFFEILWCVHTDMGEGVDFLQFVRTANNNLYYSSSSSVLQLKLVNCILHLSDIFVINRYMHLSNLLQIFFEGGIGVLYGQHKSLLII